MSKLNKKSVTQTFISSYFGGLDLGSKCGPSRKTKLVREREDKASSGALEGKDSHERAELMYPRGSLSTALERLKVFSFSEDPFDIHPDQEPRETQVHLQDQLQRETQGTQPDPKDRPIQSEIQRMESSQLDIRDNEKKEERNMFYIEKQACNPSKRARIGHTDPAPNVTKRARIGHTPLELQYMKLKELHKDAVLCVECGYRYRFFGEDAEIAARELNIVCHLDHNFMTASIPTHRLFVHVRRLVAKGYKVGVVKQTETSAIKASGTNKSALFSRQLSALYTKSTLVGEDVNPVINVGEGGENMLLDESDSFLLCVSENWDHHSNQLTLGLLAVQPSTGEVLLDSFIDGPCRSELERRILQVQPVEILVPSDLSEATNHLLQGIVSTSVQDEDTVCIQQRDWTHFQLTAAMATVNNFYSNPPPHKGQIDEKGKQTFSSIINMESALICCLGPVIQYLTEFQLEQVLFCESAFRRLSCNTDFMVLNAPTIRSLDIICNQTESSLKGSLLWILDQTQTPFGKRMMRKWVIQPLTSVPEIHKRQEAVTEIVSSQSVTLASLKKLMVHLPDLERGICSIYHKKCSTQEFYIICSSLSHLGVELESLLPAIQAELHSSFLKSLLLDTPQLLAATHHFLKVIESDAAKTGDKSQLFADLSEFPVICKRRAEIQAVMTDIMEHRSTIRMVLGNLSLDFVTVSGQEFLIEVRNSELSAVPSDWINISSTKSVSRFRSPFIVERCRHLFQLREQLTIDSNHEWINFLQRFGDHYQALRKAVHHIAAVDCLFSLAEVAKLGNYCRPQVLNDVHQIVIKEGRHPVIDMLLGEQDQYVPNDTELQGDGRRIMIITGPNMGGKSSYIRQVALISIMAQIGSYVPAREAVLGILDGIYTRMGASDSICMGKSSFLVELSETSAIMSQATDRSLVIMDELGRGTSTHDGIAIAYATLEFFIKEVKSLTLFVTHYPPLCELEKLYPQHVGNFHMAFLLNKPDITTQGENMEPEFITFLYKLTCAMAAQSFGLNVARLAKIPESILQTAALKAKNLEAIITQKRRIKKMLSEVWSIANRNEFINWKLIHF